MGVLEIEAFLTDLAVNRDVAASTQLQALGTLLFLYNEVLRQPLDEQINAMRAKKSRKLPTVLTPEEARSVIQQMSGVHRLIVQLLYGSGLRLREVMQLRIKDLDFPQHQIILYFWHQHAVAILAMERLFATICMKAAFKRHSNKLCDLPRFRNMWGVIHFLIALRPIY